MNEWLLIVLARVWGIPKSRVYPGPRHTRVLGIHGPCVYPGFGYTGVLGNCQTSRLKGSVNPLGAGAVHQKQQIFKQLTPMLPKATHPHVEIARRFPAKLGPGIRSNGSSSKHDVEHTEN